jgi:hypothetical protein
MDLLSNVKFDKDKKNYLRIKVTPRQPKTEFYWLMDDGTIKIRLKAIPEKWKANTELISFLSKELHTSKDKIDIISWASDSIKLVRVG